MSWLKYLIFRYLIFDFLKYLISVFDLLGWYKMGWNWSTLTWADSNPSFGWLRIRMIGLFWILQNYVFFYFTNLFGLLCTGTISFGVLQTYFFYLSYKFIWVTPIWFNFDWTPDFPNLSIYLFQKFIWVAPHLDFTNLFVLQIYIWTAPH